MACPPRVISVDLISDQKKKEKETAAAKAALRRDKENDSITSSSSSSSSTTTTTASSTPPPPPSSSSTAASTATTTTSSSSSSSKVEVDRLKDDMTKLKHRLLSSSNASSSSSSISPPSSSNKKQHSPNFISRAALMQENSRLEAALRDAMNEIEVLKGGGSNEERVKELERELEKTLRQLREADDDNNELLDQNEALQKVVESLRTEIVTREKVEAMAKVSMMDVKPYHNEDECCFHCVSTDDQLVLKKRVCELEGIIDQQRAENEVLLRDICEIRKECSKKLNEWTQGQINMQLCTYELLQARDLMMDLNERLKIIISKPM